LAYDVTSAEPERLLAALGNSDAAALGGKAAERILELFLREYSDGESIMDCLQRTMIVDEVTRHDRMISGLAELCHRM